MKAFSINNLQLFGLVCLLTGLFSGDLRHAEAQKRSKKSKSKSDKNNNNNDNGNGNVAQGAAILEGPPSCGGAKARGCVIATGKQVVEDEVNSPLQIPSISAVATLSFEFDPAFTEMRYMSEVSDRNNQDPTFGVIEAALVCGQAGEVVSDANLATSAVIAFLQFDQRGALVEDQVLDIGDILASAAVCGETSLTTIAALYQAMIDEQVFLYVEVKDKFNASPTFVRGQIYLPQGGFSP